MNRDLEARTPRHSIRHERRDTVTIVFGSTEQREYHIRGAVAWPRLMGEQYVGYVVVLGLSVQVKAVQVLAEQSFVSVQTMFDHETGRVEYEGLGSFVRNAWQRYLCGVYFWRGQPVMSAEMRRDVRESADVQPKPVFREVHWHDGGDHVGATIARALLERRLSCYPDSRVHREMTEYLGQMASNRIITPALEALACGLTGLAANPWRGDTENY